MAMTVVMARTMMKLPDRLSGRLVRLREHSSGLERLELCHEKYIEGCYERWY